MGEHQAIAVGMVFLLGVLVVQWLPLLPPRWSMLILAGAAGFGAWQWPLLRLPMIFLLGIAWASWRASLAMEARLPRTLEGHDLGVTGQVIDLPRVRTHATTFQLRVTQATWKDHTIPLHGLLRLAWYGRLPTLLPCSRWHLLVRLKRPHGMMNPGGMDSERYALEHGIVAVGYVRKVLGHHGTLAASPWCLDRLRGFLSRAIELRVPDRHDAAFLRAFTVGDTRGLTPGDWDVARGNGVSHLLAISGFHVGVAAVFGLWLVRLFYAVCPLLARYFPRPPAQALGALLTAISYGGLAGFGLPTVRTLLMITVVALAHCWRRHVGKIHVLVLALTMMLVFDPLAVLAAGFWLSFIGVAFLLLCLDESRRSWRTFLRELYAAQWVMTVALLPLGLWFFGETSLISAFSNLIAVPLVSFAIVPCALLGLLLMLLWPLLATPVWRVAAAMIHGQWWLLEHMAGLPGAHWSLPTVSPWALLLAMLGAVWLLMLRGAGLRMLGVWLFLPLLWPSLSLPQKGAFRVYVLDVGQGLSILVRTRHHAMVYDTGARYASGFDLGQAVVVPSLHALGVQHLDRLVISHADNDHAGGARAVARAFPQAQRWAGEPDKMKLATEPCLTGRTWTWDQVRFRVIHDLVASPEYSGNNRSCVLLVENEGGRLLLTGDITRKIEPAVANVTGSGLPLVLLVPHHGSLTSSSIPFIHALHPVLAIVSTGWHNRFGLPRPQIVRRYASAHIPLFNTALHGAVVVYFPRHGRPHRITTWRQWHRRYWRE